MRDDFSSGTKDILAKRVGFRCSNTRCRKPTSGPQDDPSKAVNIGVAAHITAASAGGPRYNAKLSPDERSVFSNGIWLCQSCAKLIDSDEQRYTVEALLTWKRLGEAAALRALETQGDPGDGELLFLRLEELMPDLLDQMRVDLAARPLSREFVLLKKIWTYWDHGELFYFYEEVPELDNKIRILENYQLVSDIAFNDVKRYAISEALARYLAV